MLGGFAEQAVKMIELSGKSIMALNATPSNWWEPCYNQGAEIRNHVPLSKNVVSGDGDSITPIEELSWDACLDECAMVQWCIDTEAGQQLGQLSVKKGRGEQLAIANASPTSVGSTPGAAWFKRAHVNKCGF